MLACVSIASDVNILLVDEPGAAVECYSLLASCFFAVAREARPARVRQRRAGLDAFHCSTQDEKDRQNHDDDAQHGVHWKVGDVIKHKTYGYTGNEADISQQKPSYSPCICF